VVEGAGLVQAQHLHEAAEREVLPAHQRQFDRARRAEQPLHVGDELVADAGAVPGELLREQHRHPLRLGEARSRLLDLGEQLHRDAGAVAAQPQAQGALVEQRDAVAHELVQPWVEGGLGHALLVCADGGREVRCQRQRLDDVEPLAVRQVDPCH
jgi:hypothetical protein